MVRLGKQVTISAAQYARLGDADKQLWTRWRELSARWSILVRDAKRRYDYQNEVGDQYNS